MHLGYKIKTFKYENITARLPALHVIHRLRFG